MASIHSRTLPNGDKRYEVRWRDGDKKDRSRSFPDEGLAKKHRAAVELERYGGPAIVEPSRITVRAWSEQWLKAEQSRLAPVTHYGYQKLLDRTILPVLGDRSIGHLTVQHLRTWMTALTEQKSATTAAKARRCLHRMLEVAVIAELIPRNPCTKAVKPPKTADRDVAPLTPKQLVELADAMGGEWRALVLVAGTGGLRRAELGALRRQDVSPDGRTVTVTATLHPGHERRAPKTRAGRRTVKLPPIAAKALIEHLATYVEHRDAALLWPTIVTSGTKFGKTFRAARATIGRPDFVFHDLRHTAITLAIAGGADAKVVQAMAGHATLAMTLGRYGHMLPSSAERVAEAVGAMFEDEVPKVSEQPAGRVVQRRGRRLARPAGSAPRGTPAGPPTGPE